MWLYHRVMSPNDTDRMANSVDPDQTAPLGAVWSGSALFAQAYLSENLGSFWYMTKPTKVVLPGPDLMTQIQVRIFPQVFLLCLTYLGQLSPMMKNLDHIFFLKWGTLFGLKWHLQSVSIYDTTGGTARSIFWKWYLCVGAGEWGWKGVKNNF